MGEKKYEKLFDADIKGFKDVLKFKGRTKGEKRFGEGIDTDVDGVPNLKDCAPLDSSRQDGEERWIQAAVANKGALSKSLGIPEEENIPMGLLDAIVAAEPPEVITNPTKTGRKRIRVTRKMEQRAILARNLKKM